MVGPHRLGAEGGPAAAAGKRLVKNREHRRRLLRQFVDQPLRPRDVVGGLARQTQHEAQHGEEARADGLVGGLADHVLPVLGAEGRDLARAVRPHQQAVGALDADVEPLVVDAFSPVQQSPDLGELLVRQLKDGRYICVVDLHERQALDARHRGQQGVQLVEVHLAAARPVAEEILAAVDHRGLAAGDVGGEVRQDRLHRQRIHPLEAAGAEAAALAAAARQLDRAHHGRAADRLHRRGGRALLHHVGRRRAAGEDVGEKPRPLLLEVAFEDAVDAVTPGGLAVGGVLPRPTAPGDDGEAVPLFGGNDLLHHLPRPAAGVEFAAAETARGGVAHAVAQRVAGTDGDDFHPRPQHVGQAFGRGADDVGGRDDAAGDQRCLDAAQPQGG